MLLVLAETKYKGRDRDAHSFFILALERDEQLASCSSRFTSMKTTNSTHHIGSWVVPRVGPGHNVVTTDHAAPPSLIANILTYNVMRIVGGRQNIMQVCNLILMIRKHPAFP
jgi:hypothetical protein